MRITSPDSSAAPDRVKSCARPIRAKWHNVYLSAVAKHGSEVRAIATADTVVFGARKVEQVIACAVTSQPGFAKLTGTPRFTKPVLPSGLFKHPVTGRKLELSDEVLTAICDNTNQFIRDGNQCSFPDGHEDSARANMGWWLAEFKLAQLPDPLDATKLCNWIVGTVEVPKPTDVENIDKGIIKYVSAGILQDYEDAGGRKYRYVMYHVCGTPRPVIPGQKGFERVELSIGGQRRVVSVMGYELQGRKNMSFGKIAVKLGLDETADEAAVVKAIEGLSVTDNSQEFAKLSASLDTMKKQNEALKLSLDSMAKKQRDEFVLSITQKAVELGSPLAADEIKKVANLLDRGLEAEAKDLADSYLSVAKLKAKPAGAKQESGDEAKEKTTKLSATASLKKMLESQGYKVTLSADGTQIASSVPPEPIKL